MTSSGGGWEEYTQSICRYILLNVIILVSIYTHIHSFSIHQSTNNYLWPCYFPTSLQKDTYHLIDVLTSSLQQKQIWWSLIAQEQLTDTHLRAMYSLLCIITTTSKIATTAIFNSTFRTVPAPSRHNKLANCRQGTGAFAISRIPFEAESSLPLHRLVLSQSARTMPWKIKSVAKLHTWESIWLAKATVWQSQSWWSFIILLDPGNVSCVSGKQQYKSGRFFLLGEFSCWSANLSIYLRYLYFRYYYSTATGKGSITISIQFHSRSSSNSISNSSSNNNAMEVIFWVGPATMAPLCHAWVGNPRRHILLAAEHDFAPQDLASQAQGITGPAPDWVLLCVWCRWSSLKCQLSQLIPSVLHCPALARTTAAALLHKYAARLTHGTRGCKTVRTTVRPQDSGSLSWQSWCSFSSAGI